MNIMKKSYSIQEFVEERFAKYSVEKVLKAYKRQFERTFNQESGEFITLDITFSDSLDMTQFYQELKYNDIFNKLYSVRAHKTQDMTLQVTGKSTLFDYLGSKEPNLLTISRSLKIDFKVQFKQAYSGTDFFGHVVNGELLSRQCIVEVSDLLPELSLGLLSQIGETQNELDLLLTRIIFVPAVSIL